MEGKIQKFYELTKLHPNDINSDFPPEDQWPLQWIKILYKSYPRFPKINLKPDANFFRLQADIETNRSFGNEKITFEEFSSLLLFSCGLNEDRGNERRFYPSAGARYPIEMYILASHIVDLERGIYHFNVKDSCLEKIIDTPNNNYFHELVDFEPEAGTPNILLMTSVISRSETKYGINSYRYSLIEAGHIGQNIYQNCFLLNIACCALGGIFNDNISSTLDLDKNEIPIYAIAFGKKIKN